MIDEFLRDISRFILNPIIGLVFAIALLVFFWGIFQFIKSETADAKRDEGKRKITWGLVGMFVMISAYGLITFVLDTFGIKVPTDQYPFNQ